MKIDFIVLTWNSDRYISNCLNSIKSMQNKYKIDVYIIDNGSTDDTRNIIKRHFSDYHIIELNRNIGTTKSRNMALRKITSNTDFICILDSDTVVNENALNKLIECISNDSSVGIAVPSMHNLLNENQVSCKHFPTLLVKLLKSMPFKPLEAIGSKLENYDFSIDQNIFYVDYGISACWMIKFECFEITGILDEKIFYAPEDVDYCLRTWKNGYKVAYVKDAEIIHDTQRISKKRLFTRMNFEHIKGLLYFFHKHGYWFRRPKF